MKVMSANDRKLYMHVVFILLPSIEASELTVSLCDYQFLGFQRRYHLKELSIHVLITYYTYKLYQCYQ